MALDSGWYQLAVVGVYTVYVLFLVSGAVCLRYSDRRPFILFLLSHTIHLSIFGCLNIAWLISAEYATIAEQITTYLFPTVILLPYIPYNLLTIHIHSTEKDCIHDFQKLEECSKRIRTIRKLIRFVCLGFFATVAGLVLCMEGLRISNHHHADYSVCFWSYLVYSLFYSITSLINLFDAEYAMYRIETIVIYLLFTALGLALLFQPEYRLLYFLAASIAFLIVSVIQNIVAGTVYAPKLIQWMKNLQRHTYTQLTEEFVEIDDGLEFMRRICMNHDCSDYFSCFMTRTDRTNLMLLYLNLDNFFEAKNSKEPGFNALRNFCSMILRNFIVQESEFHVDIFGEQIARDLQANLVNMNVFALEDETESLLYVCLNDIVDQTQRCLVLNVLPGFRQSTEGQACQCILDLHDMA